MNINQRTKDCYTTMMDIDILDTPTPRLKLSTSEDVMREMARLYSEA